jgi:chemotaxis protein methyltransferase WspC
MVRFFQASVVDPRLLEESPPYDIVFCRNLLIYLGEKARVCLLAVIDRLLTADGVLFVGHVDRPDRVSAGAQFAAVGDLGCFAYCRETSAVASSSQPENRRSVRTSGGTVPSLVSRDPAISTARTTTVLTRQGVKSTEGRALPLVGDKPLALLDQAAELANKGRFDEAVTACKQHLQLKGLSPPAYFLMGMVYQASGDRGQAEDCFHKTVYLDPRHDEALLALALLAERRGHNEAAVSFRRRAERCAKLAKERVI